MFMFDPLYLLFALPGLLLALIAQGLVQARYARASRIPSRRRLTGAEVAEKILHYAGVSGVRVEPTEGFLSDHYHPKEKALRLSMANYHGDSLAAVGVAAHEVGHALQDRDGYAPLTFRSLMVPVAQFGQPLAIYMFPVGLLLAGFPLGQFLMLASIVLFCGVFLFTAVTLPVEFNASARAVRVLEQEGILDPEEIEEVRKVLQAAALTYVAAAAQSLLILLYFLSRYSAAQRRDE